MFFDERKTDKEYQELLLAIARKQQEILLTRFDWNEKAPKIWPPKGFLGTKDKKAIARYDTMVEELEQLKAKTVAHRKKQGYAGGSFWWNVNWDDVLAYLVCDLYETEGGGPWRFEREWQEDRQNDVQFLFLKENGHCSDFSSNSQTMITHDSIYSESQQSAMVESFRKAQKESDARRAFWSDDSMVYSRYSNTLYASERDYLSSTEHWMEQNRQREKYARSLYTEHITQEVTVVSNSRHYECILAVAAFKIDGSGVLELLQPLSFELCANRGRCDDVQELYEEKDSMVVAAGYLADKSSVRAVPMQIFGKDMTAPAANFAEAIRQAEVYTCLAHKLQSMD